MTGPLTKHGVVALGVCLAAASCGSNRVEVVLSDDPWEPQSVTIELGEETVDNCLGDETHNYLEGATVGRTYRRDLTEKVGASLGVDGQVAAKVEASLEIKLDEELRVDIPSEVHPVPPRDSRKFKRLIIQDYRLGSVAIDGENEPLKVLWAERFAAERIRGTGNLCASIPIPEGLVGKLPSEVASLLGAVGIEVVPIEFENSWCDSIPGRVSAVRFVKQAHEEVLEVPVLVEPVKGDRPELHFGDVVEMVIDVESETGNSLGMCVLGYESSVLDLPVSLEAAGLSSDLD